MRKITQDTSRRHVLATIGVSGIGAVAGCLDTDEETTDDTADDNNQHTGDDSPEVTDDDRTQPERTIEIVAEGLDHPWGMAFIPETDILLVTERSGSIVRIDTGTGAVEPVDGVPTVHASGQGGLLDVCLFRNGEELWIYLTYAVGADGGSTTALGRGTFGQEANQIEGFEELYTAEPIVDSTQHYGSRVEIGPDETVFMTVGDRGSKNFGDDHTSQRLDTDMGAVLRLNADGSIPSNNPFIDDDDARDALYSVGHRNPQGLAFHPETDDLWLSDHGEQDGDSLTIVEEGGNHGWPIAHYGCTYDEGSPIGDTPGDRDDIVDPVYYWECNSGGFPPGGMTFYQGDTFPDWDGDLFVGTLAGEYLGRFAVDGTNVSEELPVLADQGWRIRDVIVGPEAASLYIAVDAASAPIVRIVPA